MTRARLLSRLRRRLPSWREDAGSMPMALLIVMVGMALGAIMLPIVITQDHTTSFDNRRVHELDAAQTGFDVALGYIRAATASGTTGVTAKLPCAPDGKPLTGTVDGAGTEHYSVTLAYYTQNPAGHDQTWLDNPDNKMTCVDGYGTYLHATDEYVPSYVLMTSTGTDTSSGSKSGRTLQTTYIVQTTNTNISGGTIAIYPQSNGMCMAAAYSGAKTPPPPGTNVALEPCETDKTNLHTAPPDQLSPGPFPWQVWSYNADLSIQLVASQSTDYPNGLCLDATTPHSNSSVVQLRECTSGTHEQGNGVSWNQQWSIDDNSHLQGANSSGSDIDGYCINVGTQQAGTQLTLLKCAGGTTDGKQTWVPSPDAGAGSAGAANNQVVNFEQFGRCLDVTNQSVTGTVDGTPGGNNFVIAYTCKQDPDPTKVAWNQKFDQRQVTYNGQSFTELVTNNGTDYCLNSPLTAYTSKNSQYVNVVKCPGTIGSSTTGVLWTANGTNDSKGDALPYADKFTVVDATGDLCLTLTSGSDDAYNGYSKAIVTECDGSTAQKWNAQANVQTPLLVNTIEK